MICSLPLPPPFYGSWPSLVQALIMVRFFVFAAALEHWLLRDPRPRLWLRWVVQAVAAYIGIQCLTQYATGRNFFGDGRFVDGELTGPFYGPRAGPDLLRILFPALLPPVMALIAQKTIIFRAAGVALAALGIAVMVLIGQRMPVLLTGLGLIVSALLLPRLRPVAIAAILVGGLVLAASPVISPPTYYRLVEKFSRQMDHFQSSPYGLLLRRADEITEQHPILGRGFNGFRIGCLEPRYFVGWTHKPGDNGLGASVCAPHPHNFYTQASTDGGYPGLFLFALMVLVSASLPRPSSISGPSPRPAPSSTCRSAASSSSFWAGAWPNRAGAGPRGPRPPGLRKAVDRPNSHSVFSDSTQGRLPRLRAGRRHLRRTDPDDHHTLSCILHRRYCRRIQSQAGRPPCNPPSRMSTNASRRSVPHRDKPLATAPSLSPRSNCDTGSICRATPRLSQAKSRSTSRISISFMASHKH
jgi:hypothetical protein